MMTAGTRLGPYEIVSAIGAGGMGEVYRARDTKLGRDVALKILPGTFASDTERLRERADRREGSISIGTATASRSARPPKSTQSGTRSSLCSTSSTKCGGWRRATSKEAKGKGKSDVGSDQVTCRSTLGP